MLEMRGITKRFADVVANRRVDLTVESGEVHGLLGENGAGKTTLMNVLFGLYQPDEGDIFIRGERARIRSSEDAIALGIGMVHQHFMLVPTFTVAENVVLGMRSQREPLLDDQARIARRLTELAELYGLHVDPHARIWELSVGEQQRVEILKALYRGADLLILDEPTAVLTPTEATELFAVLRSLIAQGKSVIFISHKLDEVMAISHRVTVLRDGEVVGTVATRETRQEELIRMMVGRDVLLDLDKSAARPGPVVLELEDVHAESNKKGVPALKGVTLRLHAGEILGIAGVDGNGQSELEDVIVGLRAVTDGRIRIFGQDVTGQTTREIHDHGVAHIPSDRNRMGILENFTIAENSVLETFDRPPFVRRGLLDWSSVKRFARRLMEENDVRAAGVDMLAGHLSGGNAQKLVLGRELSRDPRILIAAQPTRGLDIASIEYVRRLLLEQRDDEVAVLLISTELEEIFSLSDRIAVMYEGRIIGVVAADEADTEQIGSMMAGIPAHDESRAEMTL